MNKLPITWIHVIHNKICEQTNKYPLSVFNKKLYSQINTIFGQKFIIVHNNTLIHLKCYCGCVFCSILRLCIPAFAYSIKFFHIQSQLRKCRSTRIRPGACNLPYYCASLVCVPAVFGLLAVWRYNRPKTKNQNNV